MTRVLAVRLDSVGDVLVCGPAIRALAARPDVDFLTLLAGPQGSAAAELLPGPDEVLTWESPWTVADPPPVDAARIEALRSIIASRGFDEAVILTSFHQSPLPTALVLRLAGVPRITGASADYPGALLDVRLRPGEDFPEDQPETSRALDIARAARFPLPADDDGRLRIKDPAGSVKVQNARAAAAAEAPDLVILHPGSSASARAWPEGRCAEAVEALTDRGWSVAVTGSTAEVDLTGRVAGTRGIDLGGALDLRGLSDLIGRARAIVVGNTGPAHLAAAVGTPVVSLFSPVVPAVRWAPHGVPLALLGEQDAPCRGTRAAVCPVPGHPCLTRVTAEDVVGALDRLIGAPELVPGRASAAVPHVDLSSPSKRRRL